MRERIAARSIAIIAEAPSPKRRETPQPRCAPAHCRRLRAARTRHRGRNHSRRADSRALAAAAALEAHKSAGLERRGAARRQPDPDGVASGLDPWRNGPAKGSAPGAAEIHLLDRTFERAIRILSITGAATRAVRNAAESSPAKSAHTPQKRKKVIRLARAR